MMRHHYGFIQTKREFSDMQVILNFSLPNLLPLWKVQLAIEVCVSFVYRTIQTTTLASLYNYSSLNHISTNILQHYWWLNHGMLLTNRLLWVYLTSWTILIYGSVLIRVESYPETQINWGRAISFFPLCLSLLQFWIGSLFTSWAQGRDFQNS